MPGDALHNHARVVITVWGDNSYTCPAANVRDGEFCGGDVKSCYSRHVAEMYSVNILR